MEPPSPIANSKPTSTAANRTPLRDTIDNHHTRIMRRNDHRNRTPYTRRPSVPPPYIEFVQPGSPNYKPPLVLTNSPLPPSMFVIRKDEDSESLKRQLRPKKKPENKVKDEGNDGNDALHPPKKLKVNSIEKSTPRTPSNVQSKVALFDGVHILPKKRIVKKGGVGVPGHPVSATAARLTAKEKIAPWPTYPSKLLPPSLSVRY